MILAPPKKYRILIEIALLDQVNYAVANAMSDLFWAWKKENNKNFRRLRSLLSQIRLGNKAIFWKGKRDYILKKKITPITSITKSVIQNDYLVFYFKNPPMRWGVNFAEFEMEIEVKSVDWPRSSKGVDKKPNFNSMRRLVQSTDFWPVDSKSIDLLKKKLDIDDLEDWEKVIWIHHWIKSNIRGYPGPSKRLSVEKTIISRRGNCWEVSDLFVTLCRKYGIPARQLGGWLYQKGKISAGHAWAEVFLKEYGWIPIDALRRSLTMPDYYIPYFATDDGKLPVVYLSVPRVFTG